MAYFSKGAFAFTALLLAIGWWFSASAHEFHDYYSDYPNFPPSLPSGHQPDEDINGSPPDSYPTKSCSFCIVATLQPPAYDVRPYRFDEATCAAIQQKISDFMNSLLEAANIYVFSPFVPTDCSGTQLNVCGAFNGSDVAAVHNVKKALQQQLPVFLELASDNDICQPQLEGYQVVISTEQFVEHRCLDDLSPSSKHCDPWAPFPSCSPSCRCDKNQGVLPYTVSPNWYTQPGNIRWGRNVTEYCFTVNTVDSSQLKPSSCYSVSDALAKIEWSAEDTLRSAVRGFTVYPAGGPMKTIADSWGATGTDTLKVTLNWTEEQANGGVVCVAIQNHITMSNLCKTGYGQCYVSIYNSYKSGSCCPTYRTGPPRQ
ncbi:extracellular matrix glycoprotein pherophorin-V3 [Volvox carteri f. nagariensis]|uniref:Extracellular matrix glycoprotein pherophorin-V3 n=1 Tax=Volvox carteri f. nagariensis TaxID=3068 RepID=Q3HTK8_VOLCA|nr:extracellular matrix glycoprotein pherophorin-V3 [Volvox carteri f. nagariensis]ABA41397.1 pherophorin-V3 protein precursor [Volvox carteri f. nagariensis]EFJ40053.1 extracellular matrix glycoprotein pherophorin-V3 [Volvox carteri f. nagariensis]|eukprot:XP_002958865.1 extracellular matrix glycoprotein pherophorin-V3 [Volvox carteri f. nagariensis]